VLPPVRRAWQGKEEHDKTAPTKGTYPTPLGSVAGYVAYNWTLCDIQPKMIEIIIDIIIEK
jgi:hypothetical protein